MSNTRHPVINAALWMVGTLLSFSAMAIGGRELSAQVSIFEILVFRSAVGLLIISALLSPGGWSQISGRRFGWHLTRSCAHYAGQYGWFYGITLIPLAEVFALEFTIPVWIAILAVPLLRERMTPSRWLAVGLGIVGMLIILRPGLAVIRPAALAVLAAAVGFALTYILTRKLALVESPLAILFYMNAIQLPLALAPASAHWVTPTPAMWPWALVIGITGLTSNYCLARAMALADATVVGPMDFLRLPLIAVVGLVFYGEEFDWLILGGAAIMCYGILASIRAERANDGRTSTSASTGHSPVRTTDCKSDQ